MRIFPIFITGLNASAFLPMFAVSISYIRIYIYIETSDMNIEWMELYF